MSSGNPFELLTQSGVKQAKPKPKKDSTKKEVKKEQPHKEQPHKEQPHKEQPHKEQSHKEQPHKEQPKKEQPKKEQVPKEPAHKEQAPKEQPKAESKPESVSKAPESFSDNADARGRGGARGGRFEGRGGRRNDGATHDEHAPASEGDQQKHWKPKTDVLVESDGVVKPKQRAYERHSGTGRNETQKRRGGGAGNWGTQGSELDAIADAAKEKEKEKEEEKVEAALEAEATTTSAPAPAPAEAEKAKEKAEEKKPAGPTLSEEEQKEARQITFSEYEAQLKAQRVVLSKPKARKANDEHSDDWSEFVPLVREEASKAAKANAQTAQAKKKEQAKKKATKISIQDFVKTQPKAAVPRPKKQQAAPLNKNEDFPPLAAVVETKA